jgi:hypothetical protein
MPTKYVNDQHVGCAYTCKIQRLHNYPEFEKKFYMGQHTRVKENPP